MFKITKRFVFQIVPKLSLLSIKIGKEITKLTGKLYHKKKKNLFHHKNIIHMEK